MPGSQDSAALVVDDDDMLRVLMVRLLVLLGLPTVFEAHSAAGALDLLARERPAWVFTDWAMETPDAGLAVIRCAERHGLCVVVVSGQRPELPEGQSPVRFINKSELSLERLRRELEDAASEKGGKPAQG